VRVIAGSCGGRRLVAPPGAATRPTGDRVREATFNALASLDLLDGADVIDLFAGSGALGIEALSRGAAHATFVDRDRSAIQAVEANLAVTGLAGQATVVRADAERVLGDAAAQGRRWSLALLDPPYAFVGWAELLASVPAAVAVVESDRAVPVPPGWRAIRERRYGATLIAILRSQPPAAQPGLDPTE
jgi:16S rRNA (guanine966-N2)-methyltransferase